MIVTSAPCAAFGKVVWPGNILQVFVAPQGADIENVEGFELITQEQAHDLVTKHGAHLVMLPGSFCFLQGIVDALK